MQKNENVTLTVSANAFKFATKNVTAGGVQIQVADVNKLTLSDTANYQWDSSVVKNNANVSGLKGTINKRELTLKASDFEEVTKAYDGREWASSTVVRLKTGNGETGLTAENGNKGVVRGESLKLVIASDMFEFNSEYVNLANKLLVTSSAKLNAGLSGATKANYEFKYAR